MKIIPFTLFFILNTIFSLAQQHAMQVLDSDNNQPVSYAAVRVFSGNNSKGGYTDFDGKIMLEADTKMDSIVFSCIGYYPLIFYKQADIKNTVKLIRKNHEIAEVRITPDKKQRTVTIGNTNKKNKTGFAAYESFEVATFIANDFNKEALIQSILFNVKKYGESIYAVRLHLYDIDANGKPRNDLINANTVMHLSHRGKKTVKFDVSPYSIVLPVEGIFVGVEWIGLIKKKRLLWKLRWGLNLISD
ncbi:MAG: carboxypeptidase-like regulatory domain-containing protein [Cytophagaceae bacterium]|jgi:hypothetical protein|nr:carboxypeptidase-like regulatory domain-containing protein [Cytophagaceae bacterium]